MKRTLFSIVLAISLSLVLLVFAICLPTIDKVMLPLMKHFAPPEDTGLPAEEYAPVVDMITDYLAGWNGPFQHIYTVNGTEYAAFNQKEQAHMEDVQALFALCKWVSLSCLFVISFITWGTKHDLSRRTFRRTLVAILGIVTVIIILACVDFDRLFVLFHKVAFTNDLWLLNPQTDLLIRLMPIEFFVSCAAIVGGVWLAGMVGLLIFTTYRIKITKEE